MIVLSQKEAANDATKFDALGLALVFAADDLQARIFLLSMSEREYDAGNTEGCLILLAANDYLTNRLRYKLDRSARAKCSD